MKVNYTTVIAQRHVVNIKFGRVISIIVLSLYGLLIFFPMYWMITTALMGSSLVIKVPPELFPTEITIKNFIDVLQKTEILKWTWNTLLVSTIVSIVYVIISSMAGYAFAQKRFPGRDGIFWLYISTLMLPYFSYLVPLYLLIVDMRLVDTFPGLILPALSGPFGTFLMKQYMMSFPSEIAQSAKVDGCNEFVCFWKIVIPICKPAVAFLAVVIFIGQWNNFLWPMIVTSSDNMRMLQLGIALFQQQSVSDFGLIMASAALASIPVIILFFIFQRHIIGGISIGALKG